MRKTVRYVTVLTAVAMLLSVFTFIGCSESQARNALPDPSVSGGASGTASGYVYDPDSDVISINRGEYTPTDSESALTALVDAVADTVVEITTSQVMTNLFMQQYVTEGAGSGVVITSTGVIITNNHVVDDADTITVTMRSGQEYAAELYATDEMNDIAVLKIDADGLKAATFGNSETLKVGQTAVAIGNPLGSLGGSVTEGIISATGRTIYVEDVPMTLLQTTAAINPGNSGGGLFNLAGELIGIVNAKMSDTGIEGLGFAIPADTAYRAALDLLTQGYVTGRPDFGFAVTEISDRMTAATYGVSYVGVYVMRLGNAAPDTVKTLDLIVAIDGEKVSSESDFKKKLYAHRVGETVTLKLFRKSLVAAGGSTADGLVQVEIPVVQYNPANY